MARLTTIADSTTAGAAGASSDMFTRNAIACAGSGALLGLGTGSVLITAAMMPLQVIGLTAAATGTIYVGNRIADGKSVNPFAKDDETAATPAAVQGPVPAAA